MWEIIAANKRKSFALFIAMGLCLIALGYYAGLLYSPHGGKYGIIIAVAVWLLQALFSYFSAQSAIMSLAGAREVTATEYPQLHNVVEEMIIASSMGVKPRVYIIEDSCLNAFATGMTLDNSAIAITTGLLNNLSREELQGVVAHEVAHIMNRDTMMLTFSTVMLGSISFVSQVILSRGFRSNSKDTNSSTSAIAFFLALLMPLAGKLLHFAISRQREYLADATAVRLTRYPEGLAGALEKIAYHSALPQWINSLMAPMCIALPASQLDIANLTATHPPISERISILRNMTDNASYAQYQLSYSKIRSDQRKLIPSSALATHQKVPLRVLPTGNTAGMGTGIVKKESIM